MTPLPWVFEPCENEGPICDPTGTPWPHAVRGRKPAGRLVIGYGHTPPAADHDAREKAQRYDARELIGERGEVVAFGPPSGLQAFGTNYAVIDGTIQWIGRMQSMGT